MATFEIGVDTSKGEQSIESLRNDIKIKIPEAVDEASRSTKSFSDWLGKAATAAGTATVGALQLTEAGRIATPLFVALANKLDLVHQNSQRAAISLKDASNALNQPGDGGAFSKFVKAAANVSRAIAMVKLVQLAHGKSVKLQQAFQTIAPLTQRVKGELAVLGKQAKETGQQVLKAANDTARGMIAKEKAYRNATLAIKRFLPQFIKMSITGAIVSASLWGVKKAIDAVFSQMGRMQRGTIFGVNPQTVKAVKNELAGVVTTGEALKHTLDFRQAGFSDDLIVKASRLSSIIGNLSGKSKIAALEMLKTGQISADVLQAMRVPQARLLEAFELAKGKYGEILSPIQRSRVAIELLDKQMGKLGPTVRAAFPTNPFKVFGTEMRGLWQELGRFFKTEFAPVIIVTAKIVAGALRLIVKPFVLLGKVAAWTVRQLGLVGKVKVDAAKAAKQLGKQLSIQEKNWDANSKKANQNTKAIQEWRAKIKAAIESGKQASVQAREALSSLGGMASSVFSSQDSIFKDITQKALVYGRAVTLGLTESLDYLATLRASGRLTQRQFEVAKKTALDVQQNADNHKSVVMQMRHQAALAKASIQMTSEQQAILSSNLAIEKASAEAKKLKRDLLNREFDLMGKLNIAEAKALKTTGARKKQASVEVIALRLQLQQHRKMDEQIRKNIKSNRLNLGFLRAQAEVSRQQSNERAERDRVKDVQAQARATGDLVIKLREMNGQLTSQQQIALESGAQIQALQTQRIDNLLKIQHAQQKIDEGLVRGDKLQQMQLEIQAMAEQNKHLKDQQDLLKQIAEAQQNQMTTMGSFLSQARLQVKDLAAQAGQQLYNSFQGFTAGIGNLVSNTFQAIASGSGNLGETVGKGFLDALAGMAAQLGALFVAAGTAQMFVPPYTGAGAIAGGIALLGLAGTFKGLNSLIGASAPSVSTSPASLGSSAPPISNSMPVTTGQDTRDDRRPINIYQSIGRLPWDQRSDEQHYMDAATWAEEKQRSTGIPWPMGAS